MGEYREMYALSLQMGNENQCREIICFYCKEDHESGNRKMHKYIKELDIMNKMIEGNCDVYEAKGILGYRRGKNMQQLQGGTRKYKSDRD